RNTGRAPAMLTKDGWPRGRAQLALLPWLITAALLPAGCNKLARQVYYPARTPLFMEEGLREETAAAIRGQRSEVRGQEAGDSGQGAGSGAQPTELPPPTQPPGPQPAMPEYVPGVQPTSPYEPLPAAMG